MSLSRDDCELALLRWNAINRYRRGDMKKLSGVDLRTRRLELGAIFGVRFLDGRTRRLALWTI